MVMVSEISGVPPAPTLKPQPSPIDLDTIPPLELPLAQQSAPRMVPSPDPMDIDLIPDFELPHAYSEEDDDSCFGDSEEQMTFSIESKPVVADTDATMQTIFGLYELSKSDICKQCDDWKHTNDGVVISYGSASSTSRNVFNFEVAILEAKKFPTSASQCSTRASSPGTHCEVVTTCGESFESSLAGVDERKALL